MSVLDPDGRWSRNIRQAQADAYAYGRHDQARDLDPIVGCVEFFLAIEARKATIGEFKTVYDEMLAARNVQPAVSEDQPTPRVWHKVDAEPPADVTVLRDIGDIDTDTPYLVRCPQGGWDWSATTAAPEDPIGAAWQNAARFARGPLSEVLADSEQVTADPADRPEWTCTNCGTEGNPGPDDRCGCCGGHRWEFDSEQATR